MNRRTLFTLLALSLAPTLAACGGDESETPATTLKLSGVYRPVEQGAIASITFSGSADYLLMPQGCGGAACAEIGTYRLDTARHVLVLEDGVTHQTRSIALEIVKTAPASDALTRSLAPRDLIDPGEQLTRPGQQVTGDPQQVTNGNGQQLATGGNGITGVVSQLLQLIEQFIMNGQQMNKDEPKEDPKADPKDEPKPADEADPNNDCKKGVPTKDTPLAEVAAYFARCPGGP